MTESVVKISEFGTFPSGILKKSNARYNSLTDRNFEDKDTSKILDKRIVFF